VKESGDIEQKDNKNLGVGDNLILNQNYDSKNKNFQIPLKDTTTGKELEVFPITSNVDINIMEPRKIENFCDVKSSNTSIYLN
jgi:hypothetical protein